MNGIKALELMKKNKPGIKIIVITQLESDELILHALKLGAASFLTKNCDLSELEFAIRKVLDNKEYFPDYVSVAITKLKGGHLATLDLSPREYQVLRMVVEGKANKEIANLLFLELYTIESYRKSIMRKTKTTNAADLTRFAFKVGLTN